MGRLSAPRTRENIATILALVVTIAVAGCSGKAAEDERSGIRADGSNWASGGGGYDERQFSRLEQINAKTVSNLGLSWSLDLEDEHTLEATPLAVDGVLYFTGQMSKVYAVEAKTGKLLWLYDPETYKYRPEHQRYIFPANRGAAYWNGKVYVGTLDGRLVALDAKTGKERWSVMTLDPKSKMTITGAPRTYNGKVMIGSGGGDLGERGFLSAYDAETGKMVWRFYTAPGDPAKGFESDAMAMAAKTWRGEWWKTGTGGTVWNGFTYDPELNRVYIGTGNSGPYDPEVRSPGGGDNLFLTSIVAVDADTGKYIWHYQMNPREAWDYKATPNIVLTTLKIEGKTHRVLMQAPTNGFFYVIDRDTGKLLSAEKIGKVTWAERIDLKTGRPVEAPNIRYQDGPIEMWPGPYGAHNWQPMSYSPVTGLVYIPYIQQGGRYQKAGPGSVAGMGFVTNPDKDENTGALLAWDPVTQKERWRIRRDKMWNGGVLSTAGDLVFQGDENGMFEARDARSGELLWKFNAGLGIIGAPVTYQVDGRQYVSVLVGFGGAAGFLPKAGWKYGLQPRRILTFSLDGKAKLPETPGPDYSVNALDDPKLVIDQAAAKKGDVMYHQTCVYCHGMNLASAGVPAPDLRESVIPMDEASFGEFLRSGPSAPVGMPAFPEYTAEDVHALYMYIRSGARMAAKGETAKPDGSAGRF
jgi:quinohemoprotein ethanol dehydrogenase